MSKHHNGLPFVVLLSLLFAAALAPSVARADTRTEARRHFRRGMELVVQGQLDAGIAELEEAYEILPHPNVLYNIGRAYAEAGRYQDARDAFERYLETDPPDREEVRAVVAAIDQRIEARALIERAAADAAAQRPTETAEVTTSGETPAATVGQSNATPEQIAQLRSTAAQFRAIAQLSGSTTLAARADELDGIAADLERAAAEAELADAAGAGGGPTVGTPTGTGETTSGEAGTPAPTEGDTLTVAAQSSNGTYEEQVVSSSRFAQSPLDAASATTIITRQDIRLTGITVFGELLRRVAGVHVMATTPSDLNIAIRGFNRPVAPRVVVLVNGRSTYLDTLGVNFMQQQSIDVEDVERIEVVRGPASALYGANAFSGIINIITRAPGDEPGVVTTIGAGNGGQMRGHVDVNGRRGDLGYRFSTGYQQMNRWSMSYDPDAHQGVEYPVDHPELSLREVHARGDLRYRLGHNASLAVEGGGSFVDTMNLWGTAGFNDTYANGATTYAMANLQTEWVSVRGFLNRYDYEILQADQALPAMRMTGNTVDVEAMFAHELQIGFPHNIHLGVGYRWKDVSWDILDAYHTQNHYSLFFEDTMRISDAVRLTAGFRMDRHPLIEKPIWSPRVALVVRPTDGQSFRIGATSSFRTMTFAESYVQFDLPSPAATAVGGLAAGSVISENVFGASPLRPQRILTAEVGYQNQESDFFSLDLSAYYNRVWDDMIIGGETSLYTMADYADPRLAGYTGYDRESDRFLGGGSIIGNDETVFHVFGAELGARVYPAEGLDIYANYSPNYAYGTNVPEGLSATENRQPRHMVNAGMQYRSSFGLDLAADIHFYSKTLWPEPTATASGLVHQYLPLDGYYLLNGRIGYRLLRDRLEIGVTANNLTNRRIRQHPFGQTMSTRVMASLTARF